MFVLFRLYSDFFFSSEWWFCFRVICVKSFELVVFNDSECDFLCFGFCFIVWKSMVLKISITLSLKNWKPTETEIHWNWLISSHFGRFRLRISQTEIFGFGWPYTYKTDWTEQSTPLPRGKPSWAIYSDGAFVILRLFVEMKREFLEE